MFWKKKTRTSMYIVRKKTTTITIKSQDADCNFANKIILELSFTPVFDIYLVKRNGIDLVTLNYNVPKNPHEADIYPGPARTIEGLSKHILYLERKL